MSKNVTLWGASYSSVPSLNVPQTGGGTASFFDVSDTTATASDVAQGKYFYLANGTKTQGTNQGGSGDGYVWQDQSGYVHLSDEQGTLPTIDSLTVSASGTYTAPTGHVYNPVIVPSGTATPASSISGTSASVSTGTNTLTLSKTISNTPQVSGGYISSGTSGNTNVSLTASVNTRSSADLTVSGATVTAPSGYYASSASKTVASGTAGTPTATKGAVSNHSVNVTPSVTNTTGYITGSTKTGTAVSVSASELVSGTYNVTSSGTKDVTNYASASVPSGTEGTPTATKGAVSNHSVSVTPSVTNTTGYITGSTKTGTAVTVSASELVSGTKSITANGTGIDVTNYASVDVSVSGGGSSGLEYETGTWTPSADTADYTISFTGTHTSAPFFYAITDSEEDYYTVANSNIQVLFVCNSLLGIDLYMTETNISYANVYSQYRGTSTTSFSSNSLRINTTAAVSISDYATSTGIRAYTNSTSRYWRAGRAYKWIAVWAPTI